MRKIREYLFVDGYNIIFSWDELRELSETSLEDARVRLTDILSDYQGVTGQEIFLVFDAHLVKGNQGNSEKIGGVSIIYTKEDETADNFIEKTVYGLPKTVKIRVATSDSLEQMLILSRGATRISAKEFFYEVRNAREQAREEFINNRLVRKNQLMDSVDPKTAELLERMRRGLL